MDFLISFRIEGEKEKNDYFGWAVQGIGDINLDGYADFLISARNSGIIYLFYGKVTELLQDLHVRDMKASDGCKIYSSPSYFQTTVAFLQDVNKDGSADIGLSTINNLGESVIWVIFLNSSHLIDIHIDSLQSNEYWKIIGPLHTFTGLSLHGVGDVNGDGFADIGIGCLPYLSTLARQKTFIIYGKKSGFSNLDLTSISLGEEGFIVEGSGFMVIGAGDLNGDGLSDIMTIHYDDWQVGGNAYLISLPRNMTSSPSYFPTSMPSSSPSALPSSRPSEFTSFPTSFPTALQAQPLISSQPTLVNTTWNPSIKPSQRPSRIRTTKPTTFQPTLRPSLSPTVLPSKLPTFHPTFRPSFLPSPKPTIMSSSTFKPTSLPDTLSPTIEQTYNNSFTIISLTTPGDIQLQSGNEQFIIQTTSGIIRFKSSSTNAKENDDNLVDQGIKIYVLIPGNTTIIIEEFNKAQDILNLARFKSIQSLYDIPYRTNPLTLELSTHQKIILSSHQEMDLSSYCFIFSSSSKKDSSNIAWEKVKTFLISGSLLVAGILFIFFCLRFRCLNLESNKDEKISESILSNTTIDLKKPSPSKRDHQQPLLIPPQPHPHFVLSSEEIQEIENQNHQSFHSNQLNSLEANSSKSGSQSHNDRSDSSGNDSLQSGSMSSGNSFDSFNMDENFSVKSFDLEEAEAAASHHPMKNGKRISMRKSIRKKRETLRRTMLQKSPTERRDFSSSDDDYDDDNDELSLPEEFLDTELGLLKV